jgi:CheY-like chemotaxis protein
MNAKAQPDVQAKKYRVLLVDDHPIVRQGLALLIDREADLSVCGEADGARSAFHAIETLRPDIVVLDISLNGPDGLEVLKEIRVKTGSLPVLILSMHDESIYAERAMRAGANGYIRKPPKKYWSRFAEFCRGMSISANGSPPPCCSNMLEAARPQKARRC